MENIIDYLTHETLTENIAPTNITNIDEKPIDKEALFDNNVKKYTTYVEMNWMSIDEIPNQYRNVVLDNLKKS